MLTYSIKQAGEIRKFHVAVAQQWLRKFNVQKRVMHVQSCFFGILNVFFSWLFIVAVAKTPYCCHQEILLPKGPGRNRLQKDFEQNSKSLLMLLSFG